MKKKLHDKRHVLGNPICQHQCLYAYLQQFRIGRIFRLDGLCISKFYLKNINISDLSIASTKTNT